MKSGERKRILVSLQSSAAAGALQVVGRMLVATPIGRVLRGFYVEDSSDPQRVYLWAFVQPLFLPRTTVVLSLGRRLGGGGRTWTAAEVAAAAPTLVAEGTQFFAAASSPQDLATWDLLDQQVDEYSREVKAVALVAAGQYVDGVRALRTLATTLPAGGPGWMSELRARAEELALATETGGEVAQTQLRAWEASTKAALGIRDLT